MDPNHTQSTIARFSPEVSRSQVFTRFSVLKERSAIQVVDSKVKAINNANRTAGKKIRNQIIISSNDLLLTF